MRFSPQLNVFAAEGKFSLPARFWVMVLITGLGAGLGGGALMLLLHSVERLVWSYHTGTFLQAVSHTSSQHRLIALIAAGLVVAALRPLLKRATGGHGGEVTEAIWFHAGQMRLVHTLTQAVMSIVIVGFGASLGREGAPKQTGAAIASSAANWSGLSPSQHRLLVACGAGAGIAAVYVVPFGGALFALEVLLDAVALPLVLPALTTSLIATAVAWLMIPDRATYSVAAYHVSIDSICGALCLAPLMGLIAAIYIWLISRADSYKTDAPLWRSGMPLLIFSGLGLLAIYYPELLGNGKDVVQLSFSSQLTVPLLIALFLLKPMVTAACLTSGAPGGLFTPTLTTGALAGGLFGIMWTHLWPGTPPSCFAILGAGAFLAATTKGPASAVILMLELTRSLDPIMVPLMVAVSGATLIARLLDSRSIYSARIHLGRAAAASASDAAVAPSQAVSAHDPRVISAAEPYALVLRRLLEAPGGALYVVDEQRRLAGAITRETALSTADSAMPLEAAGAADFARTVPTLSSTLNSQKLDAALRKSGRPSMPIVDPSSKRLVGIAERTPLKN